MSSAALAASWRLSAKLTSFASLALRRISNSSVERSCVVLPKPARKLRMGERRYQGGRGRYVSPHWGHAYGTWVPGDVSSRPELSSPWLRLHRKPVIRPSSGVSAGWVKERTLAVSG